MNTEYPDFPAAAAALVAAGRSLTELGLSPGTSGNVSIRQGDSMLVTPSGVSLADLTPESVSVVSLVGEQFGEQLSGPPPSKEVPFHLAFYARNPQARAVVHVHSTYAVAQSCLAPWSAYSALPPLTPYLVMRVGQLPLIPYASPGDAAQAQLIREHPLRFHAVLLANHGSVTSAASVATAILMAVEIEETAKLLAAIGQRNPRLLTAAEVRALADLYGQPWEDS